MNKTTFLFPGQGSQSVGMCAVLAEQFSEVRDTFAEASEALGYDLWGVAQNGPAERLNQTEVTQPALLSAGVATWRAWKSVGGHDPDYMAGHSLGEYTALVAAGALDFVDAVKLVARRGQLMQAAVPAGTGAMAAVLNLDDEELTRVCDAAAQGQVVSCANFNSPGQIVRAGDMDAVDRACALALEAGARRAVPLPVGVPSDPDTAETRFAAPSASFTSNAKPALSGLMDRKRCAIASAPAAVVAVPATRAPASASISAMAEPIPRLAPVTMAAWPSRSSFMTYSSSFWFQ